MKRISKRRLSAAITAAAMCVSMSCAQFPVRLAENTIVHAATTISDMPSDYQYAADWIWENRIVAENSLGSSNARWNSMFDQIVDGKGTLNYVVRWHSTKTITLEQRQKLEVVLEECVNAWTDWLVGYENWPYDHIDVSIVGWAVTDPSLLLDLQDDEIVYTDTVEYVIQDGESSEIPTTMANAPSELSRFDHFYDESYEYPGGLDKRFDQYLWATQGFPDYGGCGGDWGQRLSDTYYIGIAEGTSSQHVQIHELGHGFGITDFYGGEGESNGYPPGGFPGGGTSIMMAGSSSVITDFDGWLLRYMWTQLQTETGRFDLANAQPETTEPTTEETTEATTEAPTVNEDSDTPYTIDEDGNWVFDAADADVVELTFTAPAYTGTNGVVGYWENEWKTLAWEGEFDENGSFVTTVELPDGLGEATVIKYYAAVWNNDTQAMEDVAINLTNIRLIYNETDPTEATTEVPTDVVMEEMSFTDTITARDEDSVTFEKYGTYAFAEDHHGGDPAKNLANYEVGDTIAITFIYNGSLEVIQEVTNLTLIENSRDVLGDVNADGTFTINDIIMTQKWLLNAGEITDAAAGDVCADGVLDGYDLAAMKRMLLM